MKQKPFVDSFPFERIFLIAILYFFNFFLIKDFSFLCRSFSSRTKTATMKEFFNFLFISSTERGAMHCRASKIFSLALNLQNEILLLLGKRHIWDFSNNNFLMPSRNQSFFVFFFDDDTCRGSQAYSMKSFAINWLNMSSIPSKQIENVDHADQL